MHAYKSGSHPVVSQQRLDSLQTRNCEPTASREKRWSGGSITALVVLLFMSCLMLLIALGLKEVGDDKKIPAKVRTKVSQSLDQFAFALLIVSSLQAVCVVVLLVKGPSDGFSTQSKSVSDALENLDVSRIIRKRETVSREDLLNLVHDMSCELKQAKTIQRYLIEEATHVVFTLDSNSRFVSVSRASSTSWGYSDDDLVDNSFCDYVENGPEVFKQLMTAAETKNKRIVEAKFRARDGQMLDILWTAYWSTSNDVLFCVAQDISTHRRNERARAEFIAMVTHDLKTPISTLQGVLVLLNNGVLGELNPKGKRLISNVSRDFDRLQRLIGHMLDLERTEASNVDLDCTPVSFDEVVSQAADVVRVTAHQRGIAIVTDSRKVDAFGDRDQLVRVVLNFLSNAVKFSPDHSFVELRVEDLGNAVKLSVLDEGRGIPKDRIDKVFAKFEQAKLADAKREGGTGLGLAICKAIIHKHGGTIGVRSKEGVGSEFWFTVPKQRPANATYKHLDPAC